MAATLQIYNNTGDSTQGNVNVDTRLIGNSFKTVGAFSCPFVKLLVYRANVAPTFNFEISLWSASGISTPTAVITAYAFDPTGVTTSPAGAWYTATWASPVALSAATYYWVGIRSLSPTSASPAAYIRIGPNVYSDGRLLQSLNGGGSWTGYSFDAMFEIWGEVGATDLEVSLSGAGSVVVVPSINQFLETAVTGVGSVGVAPAISNINQLGCIFPLPLTLIQPGQNSDCNQGSISLWDNSLPQIMATPLGLGSSQRVVKTPMDQDKHDGAGIVDGVETPWFEHAHLLPRLVQDMGNVISDQTILGELYNADRKNSITVTSVINNLDTGVKISGVPAVPFTIDSQDGVPFTITVLRSGGLTINSTYTFVLSTSEEYVVTIIGSRIVLLPIRPEAPFREHLIFDTKIVEAVSGEEQRIQNRQYPRGLFEATFRKNRRAIEMILFDRQSRVVAVPAWHEPAFMVVAGVVDDVTVTVNTTDYANFYVGGYAVVLEDQYTYDALKIESMTATTLTFESALSFNYTTKAQVMPLMTAYIEASSASLKKPYNDQDFNLRLHVDPTDNDIADASGWSTYDGDLFLDDPNLIVGGQLTEALRTKVAVLDNLTGVRRPVSAWEHNKRQSKKGFKTNTREELWKLRKLIHYLQGKQVSFYIPTFSKDIVPTLDMAIGTFSITMANIGYTVNARQRWPKQVVRVVLTDGTMLTRTIQNSAEVSSAVEQLTLNDSWPATYEPSDIERIEFLEKVRFDVDDIVVVHYNALGQSKCVVPIKEVDE